jgi:RNA dependent RNA polymerase
MCANTKYCERHAVQSSWFQIVPNFNQYDVVYKRSQVVAKYAARVGQSFGTSSSTIIVDRYKEIPDIKTADGRYNFSDGVGNVSPTLMRRIIER